MKEYIGGCHCGEIKFSFHSEEYVFKTETAKHLFCKLCGIKSFYQPRSHPDAFSVNLKCVDNPPKVHEVVHFDGLNFEESIKKI